MTHHDDQRERDDAADEAVDRALQRMYAEIGKSVLHKLAWLIGIVFVSLAMWLSGKGVLQH